MTRDFKYIIISLFTWGLGEGMFIYFQPLYLEELGASPLSIGAILGIVGVTMTVVHIPAGYLADRIGRRKLVWAGWLIGILTTGIMATARSLAVFSIGIILYAVTLFVMAPLNSYVTAARGNLSVERAMTTTSAAYSLGAVLGPLAGGWIAGSLGLRSIYFFAFGVFIISGTLILQIKSQTPEKDLENPPGELLKNRNFLILMPLIFMVFFAMYFPQPLAPIFLKNQLAISLQTIGVLGSITSIGNVLLNLIFGYLPTQIGLVLGQIFVGMFAALIWQTTQMPLLVAAYFLYGGYRATRSLLIAQVEKLVKKANLGLAYGITETVSGLALAAAPPLAGILYSKNPTLIFSATLLLLIPSLLLTILRRKMPWNT
jgi:MFS family permease